MKNASHVVVAQVEQQDPSPLASARLQRKLTVEEAARRAGLTADQIEWLEEGRVYRFPSADDALVAVVLYATSLGIDQNEARGLARLPVEPRPERYPRSRIVGVAAGIVVLVALAVTLLGGFGGDTKRRTYQTEAAPAAVEAQRRRPEWRRRHLLHAVAREQDRRPRLQDQARRERQTASTTRALPSTSSPAATPTGPSRPPVGRSSEAATGRQQPAPPRRDRRAAADRLAAYGLTGDVARFLGREH